MLNKVNNKTMVLLQILQKILHRSLLLTIYKLSIRPHLDYDDIIYNQTYNASFQKTVEIIQYDVALDIPEAICGSSKEKPFEELGLESPEHRRWYRKLCCFYKIWKYQSLKYLFNIMPQLPGHTVQVSN